MVNILINLNNHKKNFSILKEELSYIELKKVKKIILEIFFKKNGFKERIEIDKNYNKKIEEKLFYFVNDINLKNYKEIYKIIFEETDIKLLKEELDTNSKKNIYKNIYVDEQI